MNPRTALTACAALTLLAGAALAGDDAPAVPGALKEAAVPMDPRPLGVGRRVPDLVFEDDGGVSRTLDDLVGPRAVALLCYSPVCPVSKRYGPTLGRIAEALALRNIATVIVHSGPDAAFRDTVEAARAGEWKASVVRAPDGLALRALGARTTTEAFLVDGHRTVVYRGAVDDRFGLGYSREEPRHTWLLDAARAMEDGRLPEVEATTAPGCVLGLEPLPDDAAPTWHGRISRIVDRHCVDCHRPGESGPFPLETLEEVKAQAPMVRYMVERRAMPPWFAGPGSREMTTDHSLSDDDRAAVLRWIDADMPAGDLGQAPAAIRRRDGWRIGKPDLVIEPDRDEEVPAEGVVKYRYLRVRTGLKEDRWVRSMEVRSLAPRVVHHVLVFLKYPENHPRAAEQRRYQGGLEGFFAAMVPGQGVLEFGDGLARFLPAGATLTFQVHYTPDGTATRDRPKLGLVFAAGPPEHEVETQGIFDVFFRIPAGAKRHPVTATWTFERPGRVLAFVPHMHLRGTAFRYELLLPGKEPETVLDIPRYAFDWQLVYRLREPMDVPKGARLRATGWFDNSADNPANPDPTKEVAFGEQTFEEMMIGYFEWYPTGE